MSTTAYGQLRELARRIRIHVVRMAHYSRSAHVGSALSVADLLAVLYQDILRIDASKPDWGERDRFILSKGHAAAALYAVLAEQGFFPAEHLETFHRDGSALTEHVSVKGVPGVDLSTGSLGHGLPVACGIALAGKRRGHSYRVFTLLSDGECQEGSTWEAILFAAHHRLDNLIAVVDYNKIQSFGRVDDVLDLEPLASKWLGFKWVVREIDGHDVVMIERALRNVPFQVDRPSAIIAHTVKGKGVSFMEDKLLWHYRVPDEKELAQAMTELEASK